MADVEPIAALEIGTTMIRAVVGLPSEEGLQIIGIGESASSGVRKSEVVHLENAVTCARSALRMAEDQAECDIAAVQMVVSGGHIQCNSHRGTIPLLDDHPISAEDKEHVGAAAGAVSLSGEREIIHTIPQTYFIDDHQGVIDPLGMMGSRLSVNMMVLHGVRSRMRNVIKVARDIPLEVPDVAFAGLCAALGVLTPEEKQNGTLVIDLGGGTTNYLAYAGGVIAAGGAYAVGGDHVTNDLARGLRLTLSQAERLKETAGSAIVDRAGRAVKIDVPPDTVGAPPRQVRKGDVQLVTSARITEIFELVKAAMDQQHLLHHLGAGVILTGGGSRLAEAARLASSVFGLPCSIGRPRGFGGIVEHTAGPELATILGLVRYATKSGRRPEPGRKKGWGLLGKIFGGDT